MPHTHERLCRAVDVFIVYRRKVLLRFHDKYDLWLAVGGHIELDEDPCEAALREVMEETGLEIELQGKTWMAPAHLFEGNVTGRVELIPPRFQNKHKVDGTHWHNSFVYFAVAKSDEIRPQQESDRSDECRWFTLAELQSDEWKDKLLPDIRHYAETALREITNS